MNIKVKLKDVAIKAEVSVATVSRFINNVGYIRPETSEKIQKAINELNYKPNLIARSLRIKSLKTIGIICPDIKDSFFGTLVSSAEDVAHRYGYNVILCITENNPEKEKLYIEILKEKLIDGYIFIPSNTDEIKTYDFIKDEKVVFVDRSPMISNEISILLDNEWGVTLGMEYLIGLGHKKIGVINLPLFMTTGFGRFNGYKNALIKNKLKIDERLIKFSDSDLSPESSYEETLKLLTMEDKPTAIFPMNGPTTIGALKAIRKLGLKIPNDISIIGFDEHYFADLLNPPLTTIAQPVSEFGIKGMQTLIKIFRGKKIKTKIVKLKPKLILRESCKRIVN